MPARPPFCKIRSSSMPAPGTKKMEGGKSMAQSRSGRGSVSNENNVLLDPEVLTDYPTQVLVLTVLVGRCVCLVMILLLHHSLSKLLYLKKVYELFINRTIHDRFRLLYMSWGPIFNCIVKKQWNVLFKERFVCISD